VATIELVDQTLRDGQQSLWGMRMRAGHSLPVATDIDRVGYRVVDFTGSSPFEVLVRYCRENPWEGLDLIRAAMPTARMRAGSRANAIVGMGLTPNSVLELWIRTLARHGIGSFWVFDCLFNLEQMKWMCGIAQDEGAHVAPQVMFAESPVHTDDFYADIVTQMATWGTETIILGDEAGVLSPERADRWIKRMVDSAAGVPLEAHFHNTTGLSTLNYVTAVRHGVHILHTAVGPLANGPSMPSVEVTIDNMRRLGHDVPLDERLLPRIAEHFRRIAEAEGYTVGVAREYSVSHAQHQLPGGMTGTLLNQLRQYGMESRLDELLDEIAVVREEMGYPVMATPYSQLVGIQALLNLVKGERYTVFPDENLMYLAGHMGPIPGKVDEEVLDRAFGSKRGKEFLDWKQPQPSLREIRHQLGETLSDEELLLRYLMPAEDVDAMLASGSPPPDLSASDTPAVRMVRDLMSLTRATYLDYRHGDLQVAMRRNRG
jgi:oxaloacetate decarboxylase alpha subunit